MGLPSDKIEKLADNVANDVKDTLKRNVEDLRKHEVSKDDTVKVLRSAIQKVTTTKVSDVVKD